MKKAKGLVHTLLQIAGLCALLWACNSLAAHEGWSIPGSVLGLGIMVVLFASKLVPVSVVQAGSAWLLSELLLFFIPPVVSIIKYSQLLEQDGLMLMGALIGGTALVLIGTALVVDRVFKLESRMRGHQFAEVSHV
ncbi:CidA/LrgA family protein [Pokkaliibacter sp. CJK22405]|uniref:CidA/LrgA family protein n=1 Tax=Pokkaliibacter sp. CJK22405 TaxID=3384615 RepID=UPI0039849800